VRIVTIVSRHFDTLQTQRNRCSMPFLMPVECIAHAAVPGMLAGTSYRARVIPWPMGDEHEGLRR
jgi:hypothetical protein